MAELVITYMVLHHKVVVKCFDSCSSLYPCAIIEKEERSPDGGDLPQFLPFIHSLVK